MEGEKPLLHLDTHTNPDCGVGINIQLSLQGFYNEIQKNTEEKMNTITLQDIIKMCIRDRLFIVQAQPSFD